MLKNKIKILRIIHTLDPTSGGPQNAILDNTISLQKLGIKVDILTGDKKKINLPKKNQLAWKKELDGLVTMVLI